MGAPPADHPLLQHPTALITPHFGSRTFERVPRQAVEAPRNLSNFLTGEGECEQVNRTEPRQARPRPSWLTICGRTI